jgi:hypothetical protein
VEETGSNTIVFDHCGLDFDRSRALPVLKLEHGEWFQVKVTNTDPRKFNYTITASTEEQIKSVTRTPGRGLVTDRLSHASLAMQHDRYFNQYKLVIAIRQDLAGKASPTAIVATPQERVAFNTEKAETIIDAARILDEGAWELQAIVELGFTPEQADAAYIQANAVTDFAGRRTLAATWVVWQDRPCIASTNLEETTAVSYELLSIEIPFGVETKDWDLTFSGGVAFSNLTNKEFFIKTDDKGTPDMNDDVKTVEVDRKARNPYRPQAVALANLRNPDRWGDLGFAFGVGIGDDNNSRYYIGGSYTFGNRYVVNAGWSGGEVNRLPTGQEIGKPPLQGDNMLQDLPSQFASAFYIGIAFTFVERESEFKGKFSVTRAATPVEPEEEKKAATLEVIGLNEALSGLKNLKDLRFTAKIGDIDDPEIHKLTVALMQNQETIKVGEANAEKSGSLGADGSIVINFVSLDHELTAGKYVLRFVLKKDGEEVRLEPQEMPIEIPAKEPAQ